ncbi:TetR/AcrR family transcriptional regulator [Pullulanibacillus camelliae]|uniref:TetR/AcrR family transcriptional regulator n=1 Tax=Pullulanibacillus camelliae TaxID=1707096 RepID=UPI00166419B6|nr:TetR/AcrR family transcriptional regulator [Pullulanibacillus camelliae]
MDKRQRILEAAERSFGLFGYKATTMDQVAKLAGVAKGTIYTFFKNKEELFNEIIDGLITSMRKRAEMAIHEEDSFFDNLHRALYDILDFRREHQLTLKLSQEFREIGTNNAKAALERLENMIVKFIERHLQIAVDKGEIVQVDPHLTAFIMLQLYIALIYKWEEREQPLSREEIAQLFQRYLVLGLEPRAAG